MTDDDIRAAAARIDGHAVLTPLLNAPLLDRDTGRRIFVKAECLQKTGSFKYRGARNAIAALPDAVRARGVIAFSSGNHAQGIACAAGELGTAAVIVMPSNAPAQKIDNTRALGAEVVLYERGVEDRHAIGTALAEERGLTLIPPFDHRHVIAGQGTVGLEIAQQARAAGLSDCDVLVCCGGGGLTSGVALALATEAPDLTVRPVEPEGFDDVARSLAAGERLSNPAANGSICDAIITDAPGELTFPILTQHVGPGLVVTDDMALDAMAMLWSRLKIVAEPGGAVAVAAAMTEAYAGRDVIAVVSGGNVDAAMFARALERT